MSLFDDVSRFLETRLEEFLKAHPELELQALDEKLRQQESDTVRLMGESRAEEQRLKSSILAIAEEIKTWHQRIEKAVRANRADLAKGARDREADLLKQGNQLWGQMEGLRERAAKMETLQREIQQRRAELKEKMQAAKAKQQTSPQPEKEAWSGWTKPSANWDDLEQQFQKLEVDQELDRLRQKPR